MVKYFIIFVLSAWALSLVTVFLISFCKEYRKITKQKKSERMQKVFKWKKN